jgi:hypothetical protein
MDQLTERLLKINPGLTREDAELIAEAERIVKQRELVGLEHNLVTVENADRYDADLVADLKDRIAALRRVLS